MGDKGGGERAHRAPKSLGCKPDRRPSHTRIRAAAPVEEKTTLADGWDPPDPVTKRCLEGISETWRVRYGFTMAETTVFCALLSGMPRTALAARLQIQPETLRRHGRAIIQKTGAARLGHAITRALLEELAAMLSARSTP